MIKDVMVSLSGTPADDTRLAMADAVANLFDGQVIGLFINELPLLVPEEGGDVASLELLNRARQAGDEIEQRLTYRLADLARPWEIRRHDVFDDVVAVDVACREARTADTFVALRPNGVPEEPERLAETLIFGSGRHVLLVPEGGDIPRSFNRVMIAWNGSREAARALGEALPYLERAERVFVVAVVEDPDAEEEVTLGSDAVRHLAHHGIEAILSHVKAHGDIGATLMTEAERLRADLIVLGGYGHSRLREWLLGGVTYKLLHECTVPLLIAH